MSTAVRDEYAYRGPEQPHTASYLWPVVERALSGHRRVLDLGCGSGAFSARLASLGHEVVGVDSSRSGIAAAKRAHPDIEFVEGSAYDDLAALGTFDATVSLEVVEHCYFPRKLVASLVRATRHDGLVLVSTPYHGYLKNLLIALTGRSDAHFTALWDHGHIKFFSERTLRKLLDEALVRDVTVHRVGRVPLLAKSMVAVGLVKHQR